MCHDHYEPVPIIGGAPISESRTSIAVSGHGELPLFVVTPDAPATGAVLLIHDIYGPGAFYQDLARRLSGEGFLVALPDLFFRLPEPENDTRDAMRNRNAQYSQTTALEDLNVLAQWLVNHPQGTGKFATMGFCMGGTLVLLLAARQPVPVASVCYYGFPIRERSETQPVVAYDDAEASALESPIFGFFGDQDKAVGPENVDKYSDKLISLHKSHDFITYTGVGHGFLTFDSEAHGFEESQDSWERSLEFYRKEFAR